jgi:hypothetical protein
MFDLLATVEADAPRPTPAEACTIGGGGNAVKFNTARPGYRKWEYIG